MLTYNKRTRGGGGGGGEAEKFASVSSSSPLALLRPDPLHPPSPPFAYAQNTRNEPININHVYCRLTSDKRVQFTSVTCNSKTNKKYLEKLN